MCIRDSLITKEVNRLKGELGAIHYVGIAADEAWRCKEMCIRDSFSRWWTRRRSV